MLSRPSVVCFGEILWDVLPTGALPGGSNLNVTYHVQSHGLEAHLVSAVGCDAEGDRLRDYLRSREISLEGVARNADRPTGSVRVHLDAAGDAKYEILPGVAWDEIPADASLAVASRAAALVFGSLAQRSPFNLRSLERLLAVLPVGALRVFDVNLRAPYDDLELVHRLAAHATLLKVNAEEAARLSGVAAVEGAEEMQARALAKRTGCAVIVVTGGSRGAGILRGDRWNWEAGRPVAVVDTIGAGDSFLAALLTGLIARQDDAVALAHACRVGEWVASRRGAMPVYDAEAPGQAGRSGATKTTATSEK